MFRSYPFSNFHNLFELSTLIDVAAVFLSKDDREKEAGSDGPEPIEKQVNDSLSEHEDVLEVSQSAIREERTKNINICKNCLHR